MSHSSASNAAARRLWAVLCGGALAAAVLGLDAAALAQPAPDSDTSDAAQGQPPRPNRAPDPEAVHDPSTIVSLDGVNRIFCTGQGVRLMRENAAGQWLPEGRLFAEGRFPAWHGRLVPGNRGHLWAPDVIRLGDAYFVYYSVSTFGKNTSAIGLAVGRSLDPSSPHWTWEDRGPVIASRTEDRFNAIDPAIFRDANGTLWMTFGSFWDGIHLVELDPKTGMRRDPTGAPLQLAWAPEIEAPFLHQRDGTYFLFVNWGKCCRGVNSTYEIRVGRSRAITGPYVDREGVELRQRGGTLVLASDGRWIGPGHASLFQRDGREWLVHHYYDRDLGGRPRLRLVPVTWDADGWPTVTSTTGAAGHPSAPNSCSLRCPDE
jgi:arabinan endo-1,5-alpha-L-arabinosidase